MTVGFTQNQGIYTKQVNGIGELTQYRYKLSELSEEQLRLIARLYAEAFEADQWNEYKVCRNHHFFGRSAQEQLICSTCQEVLELAYPEDKTVAYIKEELEKPNAVLSTFEDKNGQLYGAGWGFSCTDKELANKYRILDMQNMAIQRIVDYLKEKSLFYISEVMVSEAARNNGLGKLIARELVNQAAQLKLNIIMRTHDDSPMAKIAKSLGMSVVIKKGEDTEYSNRILCALKVLPTGYVAGGVISSGVSLVGIGVVGGVSAFSPGRLFQIRSS